MRTLIPLLAIVVVLVACGEKGTPARSIAFWADGDCVERYDTETIVNRAFAFDGTVAEIADGSADPRSYGSVDVTFDVHEWFQGGGPDRVVVEMNSPVGERSVGDEAGGYYGYYRSGDRLLVSGQPRWGGEPLDFAIAWYCGFTRTHDEETTTAWRNALR